MSTVSYRMGIQTSETTGESGKKTTFLVLSDTHAFQYEDAARAFDTAFARMGITPAPFPKVDVVLHCGDLTQAGGIGEYKESLSMLKSIHAELKLVIAGNHDVSLDRNWCQEPEDEEDCSEAIELMTGPLAKEDGVTYLTEGTYTFTLSSGTKFTIYASPYTPEFGDYAFMYSRFEDRFNTAKQTAVGKRSIATNPIPDGVDIIMTHGPPHMYHDLCRTGNVGCDMLRRAIERVKPRMHCFGHIHEGAGTSTIDWPTDEDGISNPAKQTLLVNAAVMGGGEDSHDQPTNVPIIVEMSL